MQLLEKEKCCGVPLIANGFHAKARKQAQQNVGYLEGAVQGKNLTVVATSSSCTATLRDEYPHLLGVDNHAVRDSITLVTRELYRLLEQGKALPLRVAYHTPCHMEKMGWTSYTLDLLHRIPGLELVVLESQRCGIDITYCFKSKIIPPRRALARRCFAK